MAKVLAALAALLIAAAPAQATGWRTERATAIARVVWHHPCVDAMTIRWGDPIQQAAFDPDWSSVVGWAEPSEGCFITIENRHRIGWGDFCTTVIHEAGHLANFRDPANSRDPIHSSNHMSVMTASQWHTDPRCHKRGRPYLELHGLL